MTKWKIFRILKIIFVYSFYHIELLLKCSAENEMKMLILIVLITIERSENCITVGSRKIKVRFSSGFQLFTIERSENCITVVYRKLKFRFSSGFQLFTS